ncbi:unnamed protein product [Leptosia nina]|uniref:Uncharacterized protein n=1 Tax=Leptosia nina TaxID=320188 RepID=A0AAV1K2T8_9NEOP
MRKVYAVEAPRQFRLGRPYLQLRSLRHRQKVGKLIHDTGIAWRRVVGGRRAIAGGRGVGGRREGGVLAAGRRRPIPANHPRAPPTSPAPHH